MKKLFIISFITLCLLVICTGGCNHSEGYKTMQGQIWGTEYNITFKGDESLADTIAMAMQSMSRSLNMFDSTSTVARINSGITDTADSMMVMMIRESQRIHKLTDGAFDPTLGPVIDAWGFGKGHQATPDTANIPRLLQSVGIDKVEIDGLRIIKPSPDTRFNFSAIAKGYGCDLVAQALERNGCHDYLIEIGGEIRVSGNNPSGVAWNVSVDKPIIAKSGVVHDSQTIIAITDCGLATSGNYRNFHESDGKRYGHTIDPKTGRPIQSDVLSATIIAPTAMEADALATSCMVMGAEKSKNIINKLGYPALLILNDNSVWASEKFQKLETK